MIFSRNVHLINKSIYQILGDIWLMRMDLTTWKYHSWETSKLKIEVCGLYHLCHSFVSCWQLYVTDGPFSQIVLCRDYSKTYSRSKYYDEAKPWNERCDLAFACASQNEIDQSDAINLVNSGCRILVEGSYSSEM